MKSFKPIAFLIPFVTSTAFANVVGPVAQNFNPTTSGLDFVTVQSSETLKPGIVNLGLFLNYAVNSLPYFEDERRHRLEFKDSLLGLDLNAGLGLARNWDIGISLPHILTQSSEDGSGSRGEFDQTGGTEIRLNTKLRVYGDDTGGVAFIASTNINRIDNDPYVGDGGGPTFNIEAAADTTIDKVAVGGNVGYRMRSPGSKLEGSIAEPLKNQIIGSVAASYHRSDLNTKFIGEIFGSLPAEDNDDNANRSLSSAELLLGAKHDLNTNLALHAGAGTELAQGLASPDWRVYAGLNYTFGPIFNSIVPSSPGTPAEPDEELLIQLETEQTPAGPVDRFRAFAIMFKFDSDEMVGNYRRVLDELAKHLQSGFEQLIIEGHTDSIGSDQYNLQLSLRRSIAIKRYLNQNYGFSLKKISAVGWGERRPIADNGNYQGRQLNRRVDFKVRR
ncbi:MAG TPA: OmpA family protein [Bdellovibrionales bacterium]|nr:OmpA family protein [Bdellovibrionales bacterium]